jgi:hypothetical protein
MGGNCLCMNVSGAVNDFVIHGKGLFYLLRSESEALSDIQLHVLCAQLRLLEIEATNLQTLRLLRSLDRTVES